MSHEQKAGTQLAYPPVEGTSLPYLLHLPSEYGADVSRKWPLILFLHGAGERGDDLDILRVYGPAMEAEKDPAFPFICVSPQCPDDEMWFSFVEELKTLFDYIVSSLPVDLDKAYLTGFSMGGFGVWTMAMMYPELFAALAPICGGGVTDGIDKLKDIPVWAFHGSEDEAVPLPVGQSIVDAFREAGGDIEFTVYPGVGHDSWTQTYENPELYEWMLRQSK